MIPPIVHELEPITLVGGGQSSPSELRKALTLAPICVAADSGAVLAVEANVELAAVIGDFDSIPQSILARVPPDRQYHIREQESTDFEKALIRIKAPVVLGVGFCGGRVDHQLAALHVLAALPDRPCVLLSGRELILLAPPRLALPTRAGDVVSLFPLASVCGQSRGLEWPIEGLGFRPDQKIGTSNRATGPCVIEMNGPGMLLILPIDLIQPVVAALSAPDAGRWSARVK